MHMQRCRVRFSPLTIEHYSMVEVTAQLSESPQEWNKCLSLIETTKVREINNSWLRQRGGMYETNILQSQYLSVVRQE